MRPFPSSTALLATARAGCVSKVGGDKIRFASCPEDLGKRFLPMCRLAAHDYYMDVKWGQFVGRRPANAARSIKLMMTENRKMKFGLAFFFRNLTLGGGTNSPVYCAEH